MIKCYQKKHWKLANNNNEVVDLVDLQVVVGTLQFPEQHKHLKLLRYLTKIKD